MMILSNPVIITSRLLPGVQVGGMEISIEYSGRPCSDGRQRYRYYIDNINHRSEYRNDDLQSGCQGGSLQEGLESLLSFLSACGESYTYSLPGGDLRQEPIGENADLFPPAIGEWAAENSDELSVLECELQETEDLIVE